MNIRKLFFTLFFCLGQFILFAQKKAEEFNKFKEKYSSKEFDYTEIQKPKEPVENSFFVKLIETIFKFLAQLPWTFFFYLVVGLLVVIIAYSIYKNGGLFKRNPKKIYSESDFDYIEENLADIDLNHLIERAELEKNYPLIIRYLHYQSLQLLHKKGLIEWDPKKTNQQLANQIKDENIQNQFNQNTKIFNQIWFGEFQINEMQFQEFKTMFHQFNKSLAI